MKKLTGKLSVGGELFQIENGVKGTEPAADMKVLHVLHVASGELVGMLMPDIGLASVWFRAESGWEHHPICKVVNDWYSMSFLE